MDDLIDLILRGAHVWSIVETPCSGRGVESDGPADDRSRSSNLQFHAFYGVVEGCGCGREGCNIESGTGDGTQVFDGDLFAPEREEWAWTI